MSVALTYLITYVTEAFISLYFFSSILDNVSSKRKSFFFYFIAYFMQYAVSFLHNTSINILSFIIANFIIVFFIYDSTFLSSLFYPLIMTIIMASSELLAGSFLGSVYFDYKSADFKYSLFILYFLIGKSLYFVFLFIIACLFRKRTKKSMESGKIYYLISVVPILSVLILIIFYRLLENISFPEIYEHLIFISALCILFINFLIIFLFEYIQSRQQKITKLELDLQISSDAVRYNKLLEQQDENQKILVHDIKRHLQAISYICQQNNDTAAKEYADRILADTSLIRTFHFSKNDFFNMIVSKYVPICQSNHILLKIDAQNAEIDFMEKEDITALFCNIIDNAIESSMDIPNAHIELKVVTTQKNGSTLISCTNSCRTAPQKTGLHYQTQKEDKMYHGIGLRSIEKVTTKYHGSMQCYYEKSTKEFHTVLILFNKSEENL